MFFKANGRRQSNSSVGAKDRSEVKQEQLTVYYDDTATANFVNLTEYPSGAIISLVVFGPEDDFVVDGIANRIDKKIYFLNGQNLQGLSAEVKYIIG